MEDLYLTKYFYIRYDKYGEYEIRFYNSDYEYLKSIYNTESANYNCGYEDCLRDMGYREIPKPLQKAEEIALNSIKYYKVLFLGSDRWQISLYNINNKVIDDIYCNNNDIMIAYTDCLKRFECEETI